MSYTLDLGGKQDQSIISWFICDTAAGTNPRKIAVSRGNETLKTLPLTSGYVGKYLKVAIQPKHSLSDAGPEIQAVSAKPVAPTDVRSTTVSPNFRNFVPETDGVYSSGLWTVLGTWAVVSGDNFMNGYGIRPSSQASLLYQQDNDCGDMQVDLTMASEKDWPGFSIPRLACGQRPAQSPRGHIHQV